MDSLIQVPELGWVAKGPSLQFGAHFSILARWVDSAPGGEHGLGWYLHVLRLHQLDDGPSLAAQPYPSRGTTVHLPHMAGAGQVSPMVWLPSGVHHSGVSSFVTILSNLEWRWGLARTMKIVGEATRDVAGMCCMLLMIQDNFSWIQVPFFLVKFVDHLVHGCFYQTIVPFDNSIRERGVAWLFRIFNSTASNEVVIFSFLSSLPLSCKISQGFTCTQNHLEKIAFTAVSGCLSVGGWISQRTTS